MTESLLDFIGTLASNARVRRSYPDAPSQNGPGGGHVKTIHRPLRVPEIRLEDYSNAFASYGDPADGVPLALLGFINKKVDLVVSGIIPMANLGQVVTYSKTVTAASEGVLWGAPSVAFSLDSLENQLGFQDYCAAVRTTNFVIHQVLKNGLPANILLNMNVPLLPGYGVKGLKITRLEMGVSRDRLEECTDPRGNLDYWIWWKSPRVSPNRLWILAPA
jgi:5'-nucleotidase